MFRTFAMIAALGLAAPAAAATYVGKPAGPASNNKFVGRDIIWNLAGDSYRGITDEGRPVVICQSLAKRVGRLESFTVNSKEFGAEELAKCNAAAPAADGPALAEAN